MEGSFDWDVLIGDSGPNAMLGQPGEDRSTAWAAKTSIDARDGVTTSRSSAAAANRRDRSR